MRSVRRRSLLALGSAIATGAMLLASVTPAFAADPVTVSAVDFEDGTTGAWTQSGSPVLSVVADPAGGAGKVLSVANRVAGHDTIQSPTGIFTEGVTYTLSARVLVPGAASQAHFVVKDDYTWVGNTAVPADTWTTLSATYTADANDTQVYFEVDAATPLFYLDDILITKPGATAPPTDPTGPTDPTVPDGHELVSWSDFEGADVAPWTVRGSGTLTQDADAHSGAKALKITGRTANWNGPSVPGSLLTSGTYTISAWVKLVAGQAPAKLNVGVNQPGAANEYPWVGSRLDVTDATWVQIGGDFTVDPDNAPASIYIESDSATAEFLVDDVLITQEITEPAGPTPGTVVIDTDFDDQTLQGWSPRQPNDTTPTLTVVDGGADGSAYAAQVSDRDSDGDGLQFSIASEPLLSGATLQYEAWVRFADGAAPGDLTLSAHTANGGTDSYSNLHAITGATNSGWTKVSAAFTVPAFDTAAELYFETKYNSGNVSTFLVDQVKVWVPEPQVVDTSLTPLKDTVDFPVGVAIDQRETTGSAAELLLHHFNQISPENHMKVEAWYDADKNFVRNPQATALLDFAAENHLRMYGHVLVWHSQTPAWFFQDDTGRELTSSEADKQILRDRLKTHIDDVAKSIYDDYGAYGSATNPIAAWDVVNEVIADQETPDGLRTSRWHDVLGEEYIHLAFQYADEAFNHTYAAAGTNRPVKLFINDYNTEQDAKGARYKALVERLLAADVPIDGVGHQFHSAITSPVSALAGAFDRFKGLGLRQEVTELDVTANPADEPNLIKQGYFYRDAFNVFRAYDAAAPAAEKLFSVTVWGLTDNRSWRASQKPLLFDGELQAKPAYFGAAGDDAGIPPLINQADVFGGDVALAAGFESAPEWSNLPENALTGDIGGFRARWSADHLTVLVRTTAAADRVEFTYGASTYFYQPGTAGSVDGTDTTVGGVHYIAVHLPHTGVAAGTSAQFDVRVVSGGAVAGAWNTAGSTGTLTFLEPLSTLDIPEAATAPAVDGVIDAEWADAAVAQTAKTVEGNAAGAQAEVRTLWKGNTLYALYNVTDPVIDNSNSDPWNQDSVELFLDLGNSKSGPYGPNDTQIRITTDNKRSFGTGDSATQQARVLASATALTDTGYVVEVAVGLVGQSGGQSDVPLGGAGTFHGIDFQVNDGRAGARYAVHTWAEPTGTGYQNTARWGVAQLVAAAPTAPQPPIAGDQLPGSGEGAIALPANANPGSSIVVNVGRSNAGTQIDAWLFSDPILVFSGPVPANGKITVTLPAELPLGEHRLAVFRQADDSLIGWDGFAVVAPLANTAAPTITGDAIKGSTVTANPGSWSVPGAAFQYQWLLDGKSVGKKGTDASYKIKNADVGKQLSVTVTATVSGLSPVSATSAAVKVLDKKPAPPKPAASVTLGVPNTLLGTKNTVVKFTVGVLTAGPVATGTITVYDGSKAIATATLKAGDKGTITVTLGKLKSGLHKLSATYGGSDTVKASESPWLPVLIL